jgi:hypothetical protein
MDTVELKRRKGGKVVVVNGSEEFDELSALLLRAPDADAATLAKVIAHLGPPGYEVIEEPDRYAEDFAAKLATEDPDEPWRDGVVRLRDFGVPEFDSIVVPHRAGTHLTYFARDTYTGLPFRTEITLGTAADVQYQPLPLKPLPDPPPAVENPVSLPSAKRREEGDPDAEPLPGKAGAEPYVEDDDD